LLKRPNGFGKLEYPNGDVFEGQFVEGRREGRGIKVNRNGSRYEGSYKAD